MKIKSKKSLEFYISIILSSIFYFGASFLLFSIFFKKYRSINFESKNYVLLIFGILLFFVAIYTIYRYTKNAPNVVLEKKNIFVNDQKIDFEDIQNISLTGRKHFPYLIFGYPMEGCSILLKNGKVEFFYDNMYSNYWQIKSYLQKVFIDEEEYKVEEIIVDNISVYNENFTTFSRSQLLNYNGILLWSLLLPILYNLFFNEQKHLNLVGYFILSFFIIFWYVFFSWLMHHFKISNKYLVVKNANFPWINKIYKFDDIREVVFETRDKMPNCLRVITKDFRTKLFPAATLRDKQWLEMKKLLEKNNVQVFNECIF